MGFYIQAPTATGKAEYLVENEGAEVIPCPENYADIPSDEAIICVVSNGPFEAAGCAFDEREFEEFKFPDGRPRTWLKMAKARAKELSGYKS